MDHQTGWIMGSNYLLIEGLKAKNLHICLFAIISFVFLWITPKVQHINKNFQFLIPKSSQFPIPSNIFFVTICNTVGGCSFNSQHFC